MCTGHTHTHNSRLVFIVWNLENWTWYYHLTDFFTCQHWKTLVNIFNSSFLFFSSAFFLPFFLFVPWCSARVLQSCAVTISYWCRMQGKIKKKKWKEEGTSIYVCYFLAPRFVLVSASTHTHTHTPFALNVFKFRLEMSFKNICLKLLDMLGVITFFSQSDSLS